MSGPADKPKHARGKVRLPRVDFDLRQLEIFCSVVEHGSISRAAEAVHLTQSSVSERMSNLERSVGVKLLDRVGRVIVPTKAGELLYQRGLKHLALKEETRQELENMLGLRRGEIAIGGSTIPGEYILPGVIRRFQEQHPQILVRLRIQDTDRIARAVAEGQLSVGVVGSKTAVRGLAYSELWRDELVIVVPPGHRWAKRRQVAVKDVLQEPFVLREAGSGTRRLLEQHLAQQYGGTRPQLNVIAELGSSTALKAGVLAGVGVGVISARAVEVEARAGQLHVVRIEELPLTRRFYLIHDKRRTLSPLDRAFRDFVLGDAAANNAR